MIDIKKPIQTKSGIKARIVAWLNRPQDGREDSFPLIVVLTDDKGYEWAENYTEDGRYFGPHTVTDADLINSPPPPTFWYLNVYRSRDGTRLSCNAHSSRIAADNAAANGAGWGRVGCIKVKLEERFDD